MAPRPGVGIGPTESVGEPITTDAVVIGAGPVGLFQVFELGLQDIRAHVVDALPFVGGQPAQLYPDKPIYDIPGLPVCTGQGLTDALLRQCSPFAPTFHLGQTVSELARQADGRFLVRTSAGVRLLTHTVFIAAGVGAFEPRRLKVDGLAEFEGTQLFHHASQAGPLPGQNVLVVGDDDHAVGVALELAERRQQPPRSVTLLHRRESLRAQPSLVARLREHCENGRLRFVVGQMTEVAVREGRLVQVLVGLPDGQTEWLPTDTVMVLQGLSPRLGPIADWGLVMEKKLLVVDTEHFSTSVPGIFAVGDINTYLGKRKLLVCGFHECTLAAFAAAPIVHPQRPVQLQYTTSSTHLHELLGVQVPPTQ
jgi:thioredoxin reductase (NADPH)